MGEIIGTATFAEAIVAAEIVDIKSYWIGGGFSGLPDIHFVGGDSESGWINLRYCETLKDKITSDYKPENLKWSQDYVTKDGKLFLVVYCPAEQNFYIWRGYFMDYIQSCKSLEDAVFSKNVPLGRASIKDVMCCLIDQLEEERLDAWEDKYGHPLNC